VIKDVKPSVKAFCTAGDESFSLMLVISFRSFLIPPPPPPPHPAVFGHEVKEMFSLQIDESVGAR